MKLTNKEEGTEEDMNVLFAYLIPLVLFIIGLTNDRSKVIPFIFAIYFWILMGLNTFTPDYYNYERYYLFTSTVNVEPGYAFLCNFMRNIGLSYQQFRMVIAALYSILTILTVKRLTTHVNYVLAMFLFLPFVINVSGLRFALAAMIVCYGIPYLLPHEKFGDIKYILCILLASTFHVSTLFFLIYLFAKRRYKMYQYLCIAFAVIIGSILIKTSILLNLVLKFIPSLRPKIQWLSLNSPDVGHLNMTGFLANVFFVVSFPILLIVLTNILIGNKSKNEIIINNISEIEDEAKQRLTLYKNISTYGLIAIPGYFVSSEYQRFLFGVLIVYYSVFAEFKYANINIRYSDKLIFRIMCFTLTGLLLALYMYSMKSHDVLATFVDNILIKK